MGGGVLHLACPTSAGQSSALHLACFGAAVHGRCVLGLRHLHRRSVSLEQRLYMGSVFSYLYIVCLNLTFRSYRRSAGRFGTIQPGIKTLLK